MPLSRRTFVTATLGAGAAAFAIPRARATQPEPGATESDFSPITPDADARAIVGASHANIDAVRQLLGKSPSLATATVDWGFGDWESALGAASHVGRPDIAELLISHGARPDIFTFAMLGNLPAVQAAVEAIPGVQRVKGPHSLTLAHHARAGGEQAAAVLEYLLTLEGADDVARRDPVDDPAAIMGTYTLTSGGIGRFNVGENRRGLEFHMEGFPRRDLLHQGSLVFYTPGSPNVLFRFTPAATPGESCLVTIELGGRTVHAERA